jgi:hypothetical protein
MARKARCSSCGLVTKVKDYQDIIGPPQLLCKNCARKRGYIKKKNNKKKKKGKK